jgi:hypothetical protein
MQPLYSLSSTLTVVESKQQQQQQQQQQQKQSRASGVSLYPPASMEKHMGHMEALLLGVAPIHPRSRLDSVLVRYLHLHLVHTIPTIHQLSR